MNNFNYFINTLTGEKALLYAITESPYFSLSLCLLSYSFALFLQSKLKSMFLNPLLIATILCITILLVFDIPYKHFADGADLVNMMLPPVTAILAVSMYNQRAMLTKYLFPAIIGAIVGSLTCVCSILLLIKIFGLKDSLFDSVFAKSVTTPIAFALTIERGGDTSIAIAAILITGLTGAVFSPLFIKVFRVNDSIASGIAIGTSTHALGTMRALQIGELEGAMSSISIGLAGIAMVVISLFI